MNHTNDPCGQSLMLSNKSERRVDERISLNLPLVLKVPAGNGGVEEDGLSRDFSSSGTFCYLKIPLNIGDNVDIQIAPRFHNRVGTAFPVLIPATVVRVSGFDGFGMHGTALRFRREIPFMKTHRRETP
jgi:hypothetical protein